MAMSRVRAGFTAGFLLLLLTVFAVPAQRARAVTSASDVTVVGVTTALSAGGSTGTVSAPIPAGAEAGDTVIVSVTAERALLPALSGLSDLVPVQSATDGSAITAVTAYQTLAAADTTATVTATVTTVRRMSMVVAVYRNVGSVDVATAGPVAQAVGSTAVSAPSVTPSRDDATLVGLVNYLPGAAPWTTTFAPAAAWTERADVVSTHPSAWNAATWLADRALTGGRNAAQPGAAGTSSYAGGGHYFASTLALGPRTEREYRSTLVSGVDEPTAAHTGVLPDVARQPYTDAVDLTITAPGVYQNLDVRGVIHVRSSNVTISNVWVHGDKPGPLPRDSSLIDVLGDYSNVLIEHVTVRPDVPRTWWNTGLNGRHFTLRFADVSGTIDGVNLHSFTSAHEPRAVGAVLEQNYIHDLVWWTAATTGVVHPSDTISHNDAIQVLGGYGMVIRGNSLRAGPYAPQTGHWQATDPAAEPYVSVPLHSLPDGGPYLALPDRGTGTAATGRYNWDSQANLMISSADVPSYGFTFTDNWLYGGNQSVNGAGNPYDSGLDLGDFLRNRFDRTQGAQGGGGDNTWTLSLGADWSGHVDVGAGTANQNTYLDNGHPIRVRY